MLRRFLITIFCLLLLQIAVPAMAEFYEYVDARGVMHFTDNVSTIPSQYRSQLEHYHGTAHLPVGTPSAESEGKNIGKTRTDKPRGNGNFAELGSLMDQRKVLMQKKDTLIQKYKALQAEKEAIESTKGDMKNRDNAARYNKRVRKMNEKINQYSKEEKGFQDKLEKYNQSINDLETRN